MRVTSSCTARTSCRRRHAPLRRSTEKPKISNLEDTIRQLQGGQSSVSSQLLRDRVFDALDKDPELTGWQQINTSPEFIAWLQGLDERILDCHAMTCSSMPTRMAMPCARVGSSRNTWQSIPCSLHEAAHQTGRQPRPPAGGNGYAAPASGTRLENFVVPGRAAGGSGGSDGAPQPRIWSRPEISRFYRDRTEGRFKGREQESDALRSRAILAATTEGRVLN